MDGIGAQSFRIRGKRIDAEGRRLFGNKVFRDAQRAYEQIVEQGGRVADALRAFKTFLFNSDMMAYLAMMAPRLVELRRVLKETGSIYLHCDPTASHYLKILMDAVFGPQFFRNEVVWKRTSAHNDPRKYGDIHDVLLFYSKSIEHTWNLVYTPYTQEYIDAEWRLLPSGRYYKAENMLDPRNSMAEYDFHGTTARWRTNPEKFELLWNAPQTEVPNSHGRVKLGRNGKPIKRCRIMFLDDMPGVPLQSWWHDIQSLKGGAQERLGYPTQKPEALLERILKASSNEGDVVLDPFCGCGTTVQVAQRLNRRWIGIDITHLAIGLIKKRLSDAFGPEIKTTYEVVGEPTDYEGAAALAAEDKYQFQWWALGQVGARPAEQKKGADRGIDGRLYFHDDDSGQSKQIIFSVKAGGVSVPQIRDLVGVLTREKAEIGVFLTFDEPTRPMLKEAAEAGFYKSTDGTVYPKPANPHHPADPRR